MKAIITVDVPEHQIGQEVSVYFKDTMCINGTCESEIEVYAKHDAEVIKETVESMWGKPPYTEVLDKIRAEIAEYKDDKIIHDERTEMIDIVLEIIDKYRAESEE